MGTWSLTYIKNGSPADETIACIYRQYDGYPEGHGKDLAEFLQGFKVVNGLGINNPEKTANGMGCLAAQIVAHFKERPGDIYLYPPETEDVGEEYIYYIWIGNSDIHGPNTLFIQIYDKWDGDALFSTTPNELIKTFNSFSNA